MKTFRMLAPLVVALALFDINAGHASEFNTHIPMHNKGYATYYVRGSLNDVVIRDFLVDTGSGYMAINRDTLKELQGKGSLELVKKIAAVMADGSEAVVPVYRIANLKLGDDCTLQNIEAAVMPGATPNILGLSALRKAAPFAMSVDPPILRLTSCGIDSI